MLSVLGILGYLGLLGASLVSPRGELGTNESLQLVKNLAGMCAGLGVFLPWGLALYHWGTRFAGNQTARRRWGFGLTLGMFVGAWAYRLSRKSTSEVYASD